MLKISLRRIVALLSMGAVLPIGACLNSGSVREVVVAGVTQQAFEFLLDNDGIFDLFVD